MGVRTIDHLQRTFDYASEHAVESVALAVGAVAAVALTVTVVPSVIAAAIALLTTVSSVELMWGGQQLVFLLEYPFLMIKGSNI